MHRFEGVRMNLDEAVLRDGRRLLEVWPDAAAQYDGNANVARFVSIPEGQRGYVFVEHGEADNHYVMLLVFSPSGESDFVEGRRLGEKSQA